MPAIDYRPTIADVAVRLRARLRTRGGAAVDTFTTDTAPTAVQVDAIIDEALEEVAAEIGSNIPNVPVDPSDPDQTARNAAKRLVSLYAAMMVELSYFPEQVSTERSSYKQLKELFDTRLPKVKAAADQARELVGADADLPGESDIMPVSRFPRNAGGMVGNRTQF